ncbi:MAG: hypothetical protein Q8P83_04035 [bacterium]|nr:hypothetical protein [bacterium]
MNSKIYKSAIVLSLVVFLFIVATPVFAVTISNPAPTYFVNFEDNTFGGILTFFIKALLGVVGIISVMFLIFGGFKYITSGGSEEQSEFAKKTIANAVIGLTIVVLSYIIVIVILNAVIDAA